MFIKDCNQLVDIRPGDVLLCKSKNIISWLGTIIMSTDNLLDYILKKLTGKYKPNKFYHCGLVVDDMNVIEQKWFIRYLPITEFIKREFIILRNYNLNKETLREMVKTARKDVGNFYDIPLAIAYIIAWIFNYQSLKRKIGLLTKLEVCSSLIAKWYITTCRFDKAFHKEVTTKNIEEYTSQHTKEWKIVYES